MSQTSEHIQHDEAEALGTYYKEVIFDWKKYQKIISKNMKIEPNEGF